MADQKPLREGDGLAPVGEASSQLAGDGGKQKVSPPLPPEARDVIGEKLRGLYGSLVAEPLPARFTRLLDELAAKESKGDASRKPEDKS
jgi:hypothetical protein